MMHYTFYQKNPASHYVYIDLLINEINTEKIQLQLPAWRPGRYELGNYAKNVKRVDVLNDKGEALNYTKLNKDLWEISTAGANSIKVTYSYYAAELNAGACYADASQLYINPVHCCLYQPNRMNERHEVELQIPDTYKIACSLKREGKMLVADSFDELADSPFIASAGIQSDYYECAGIRFYLHFNGECQPDFAKLKKDFTAFTKAQIDFWRDFHYDEYHFLFQILPQKFYHGVEHKKNTVIAIGPGYHLNQEHVYNEVLGVSSHELFHSWNIKTIRPIEMQPYDFTQENYARTGYVYEGFTTYYGDKFLLTSKVFNQKQYFDTLQERLQKHFHNFGRFNLSVAQSSWETWLDGYLPGAPYRKTNIYDEGSLVAFMLDVMILQHSNNTKSLRDVCRILYEDFGKKEIGYTEQDVIKIVSDCCSADQTNFFLEIVYATADYEAALKPAFEYLGLELQLQNATLACENTFGFKVQDVNGSTRIGLVAPYGPAWKSGLFAGDEIIAVNDSAVRNNLNSLLNYYAEQEIITISAISAEKLKTFELKKDAKGNCFFKLPQIIEKTERTAAQQAAFDAWLSL